VGDVILSWNGGAVPRSLERWVSGQKPGELLKLRTRRDEKQVSLEFRLGEIKETVYVVLEDAHATEKARNIREGLLRGETAAVLHH
jgi:hypothetical protein